MTLTWTAPDDGGDDITRYEVQRGEPTDTGTVTPTGGWQSFISEGNSTSHPFEGLVNGQPVSFRVRAINGDTASIDPGNPSEWSALMTPCGPPAAPTNVRETPEDGSILVSWTPVPPARDGGCDVTGYVVTATAANGGTTTASTGGNGRSVRVTGLQNGTEYTITVHAINLATEVDGEPIAVAGPIGPFVPFGPPRAPQITSVTTSGASVNTITWTEPNDNGSPITDYQLRTNNGGWESLGSTATSVVRQETQPGTLYTYQVRAVNAGGVSSASNAGSVTTNSPPGRPTVTASASRDSARITAKFEYRIGSGPGIPVLETDVLRTTGSCDSGTTWPSNSDGPDAVWNGVTPGVQYAICVRHRNDAGWGLWGSDTATYVPRAPIVRANWGPNAAGQGVCSSASCRYLEGDGSDFTPGTTVSVQCQSSLSGGPWQNFGEVRTRTANSTGNIFYGDGCQFGFTGDQARLVFTTSAGTQYVSNAITN